MPPKKVRQRKIVKYNGVVLRRPDIDILNGSHFLNGRIIDFYFTYLDAYLYSDALLILPPSIALRIKETPDDNESLKELLELLHLHRRKIIIVLAFERSGNVFVHHDSSEENLNTVIAECMYEVVRPYVSSSSSSSETDATTTYMEYSNTPKQEDPSDCGVHVLAITKAICTWYSNRGRGSSSNAAAKNTDEKLWFTEMELSVPSLVSSLRLDVQELLENIIQKQKRHPSGSHNFLKLASKAVSNCSYGIASKFG